MGDIRFVKPLSGRTVVHVHTKKRVSCFNDKMIGLVGRWYRLGIGKDMTIKTRNGREIFYSGVGFSGSPREVFWGSWAEEYFEDEIPVILDEIAKVALDASADISTCLEEAVELLCSVVDSVYEQMIEVDSRLVGNGTDLGPRERAERQIGILRIYTHEVAVLVRHKYANVEKQMSSGDHEKAILEIKPELFGISVDVIELLRRIKKKFQ